MNGSAPELNGVLESEFDALLDELDTLMFRFARIVDTHYEGDERAPALSTPQYMVLRILDMTGSMRVSDVAGFRGVTNPAASMLLQAMAEEGLIDREQDSTDRRATLVSVSKKGGVRLAQAEEVRRRFMKRVTSRLSSEDLRTMMRGLNELADAIAAETA